MDNRQHKKDSYFNQTTEVGITLTGDQAKLLQASLSNTLSDFKDEYASGDTEIEIDTSSKPGLSDYNAENLADTEIDETAAPALVRLEGNLPERRFNEIKQHVLGFHSLLEKGFETSVTIAGFPDFHEIRLRSISMYESGALYIEGENNNGEWVSIFSHIQTISYALTRQRSSQRKKSIQEIEFNQV